MILLQKIEDKVSQFSAALNRFKEILNEEKTSFIVDGSIQRFEFNYELVWKLLKMHLEYQGILVDTPRDVLKQAYKLELIEENEQWLTIIEFRNLTTHTYNEKIANEIYKKLPLYEKEFSLLLSKFKNLYKVYD